MRKLNLGAPRHASIFRAETIHASAASGPMWTEVTDEVIARARAGDRQAFASLVAHYGADVLRLCTVITTDRHVGEDAAQETWRQAWRRLDTLREPARIRPWLLRVAANEAKQQLRRNRRHAVEDIDAASEAAAHGDPGDLAAVRDALRALPIDDRELLARCYVVGMTSAEVARELGISPEGVRSRVARIRQHLRREMSDDA